MWEHFTRCVLSARVKQTLPVRGMRCPFSTELREIEVYERSSGTCVNNQLNCNPHHKTKPPVGWLLLRWWVVLAESQHALARCAPAGSAQTPRCQTLLSSPLVEPDTWLKPNQQQLTPQKKATRWVASFEMVGRAGFEPATNWLKANCSTD